MTTIELDTRHAAVARQTFMRARFTERIEILQGLWRTVLRDIESQVRRGERGRSDFVFIDPNKPDNLAYFNAAVNITRERAVIVVDSVVRNGEVISDEVAKKDDRVKGTRELIEAIEKLEGVEATAIQTVREKNYDGFLVVIKG